MSKVVRIAVTVCWRMPVRLIVQILFGPTWGEPKPLRRGHRQHAKRCWDA